MIVLAAACGAAFGLGLARTLFEWQPVSFSVLAGWPANLLLAAFTAALAAALAWRIPRLGAGHSLPLALPIFHALAPNVDLLRGWTLLAGGLALTVLLACLPPLRQNTSLHRTRTDWLIDLTLFLGLFFLYLRTLAPSVGEADTFEFQVGIARLGVAHGSGYPLLMLVGRLFSLLPLGGTLAWRANLTSAFFAALGALLAQRLTRRLGASLLPSLLAGLTFGVSPTLWARAVEVEAYTLNAALVAALLYLAADMAATRTTRRLPWLAFLFGLSLTNHLTTLLLIPALGLAIFLALRHEKARAGADARHPLVASTVRHPSSFAHLPPAFFRGRLSSALLALLLGLSIYLYLPLRWPAVNHGQRLSLAQFAAIVTGNEAKGAFQWDLPLREAGRFAIVFAKLQGDFGWLGVAALALGLGFSLLAFLHGARRPRTSDESQAAGDILLRRPGLLLLASACLPYIYFGLAFNVPDPDFSAFFIPVHLITAVLIGLGLSAFIDWGERRSAEQAGGTPHHAPLASLLLTAVCLLPLRSVWRTLPLVDQSGDWEAYRLGRHILRQPLAQGATILADSQKIAPLYYLQVAEGLRPDLDIIVLPDEASYRALLDERIAEGRTVYLARYLPGLGDGYALRSVGPLAEVSPQPWDEHSLALAPVLQPVNVPGVRLLGYAGTDGAALAVAASEALGLTLAWQASGPLAENLLVSLQLLDGAGALAWRGPGRVPVGGLYPTNAWRAGEVVTDYHVATIDESLAPGRYRLQLGLFPPFAVTETGWTDVADVNITAPTLPMRPPHLLRARLGEQWLLGYALPEAAPPSSPLQVTLYWLRTDRTDQSVAAFGEVRSLTTWPPGLLAAQVYQLETPPNGELLEVSVMTGAPARCGWLAPVRAACPLPAVRLVGQAATTDARNFDHQLLLNSASLETPRAAPGDLVQVTLEWQGLRRMTEDYTVFVHLLGPDGRVHGQVDAWPVSGTQATSRWEPGQAIRDAYAVPVPADAPPGTYAVEIGLYLLASGERLPVLNEAGEIIQDRVLLEGLVITTE